MKELDLLKAIGERITKQDEALRGAKASLKALVYGSLLDPAGNRNDDGLLDRQDPAFASRLVAAVRAIDKIEEALK